MDESPSNERLTRKIWLCCVLAAIGVFALNHWYAMNHHRFYPIVVWGAPVFLLVGLAGLIHPELTEIPRITILLAILGLAIGLAVHYFMYGF